MEPGLTIASYGDMLRVPGSVPGDSLQRRRALGAKVEVVYSAMDALELAAAEPEREVLFLAVGFETTAPGTAAAVLEARERGIRNFSIYSMLKSVEPAPAQPYSPGGLQGPGLHLPRTCGKHNRGERLSLHPGGLRPAGGDSRLRAGRDTAGHPQSHRAAGRGEARLENCYKRAVRPEGNPLARAVLDRCFQLRRDSWRGWRDREQRI